MEAAEAARQEMVRQQRNAKRALLKEADKKEEDEEDGGMTGMTSAKCIEGLFGMAYLHLIHQVLMKTKNWFQKRN